MELNYFLKTYYPQLKLCYGSSYNWNIRVRFKLDNPDELKEINYIEQVYSRTIDIFKEIFRNEDKILIVFGIVFSTDYKKRTKNPNKAIKELKNYVNNIETFKILKKTFPKEELEYHYIYGICTIKDFDYISLIKRCGNYNCNYNPNLVPHFEYNKKYGIDVYFINITNNSIYNIHDDHVCDLLSTSYDNIVPIYLKFKDWAYRNEKIDEYVKSNKLLKNK